MTHDRVITALTRLGGFATWGQLRREVSGRRIKRAVAAEVVVRTARGRYALPVADEHRAVAHRLTGTLSHLSAAVARGWPVKHQPKRPWVTFRRQRHLAESAREEVVATWSDLSDAEVAAGVTSPLRTVLDCARRLPFDEALAVADSALRAHDVGLDELRLAATGLRGPGAAAARRVARWASALSANPFESVLRAIALGVPELHLVPQLAVWDHGLWARVDLGDESLLLALEAEGFAAHRTRKDLARDCARYTDLSVHGWTILRFSWEDVMLRPDYVRWAITSWLGQRAGQPVPAPPRAA